MFADVLKNVPRAMEPVYATPAPNAPINLYTGELELRRDGTAIRGGGIVRFEWLPHPHIAFELSGNAVPRDLGLAEASLWLPDRGLEATVNVTRVSIGRGGGVGGRVTGPLSVGAGASLAYVLFHLTNFEPFCGTIVRTDSAVWWGRAALQTDEWNVLVDSIEWEALRELGHAVEAAQGYAITHVGKIERSDGSSFTRDQASGILDALHCFFSFVRGFWSTPVLAVGFDASGQTIWEEWIPRRGDHWCGVDGWFDGSPGQGLGDAFPGFLKKWRQSVWQDSVRRAIHWYLECNNRASVDSGIVLAQVGLDLLSWVSFVETSHTVSADGFDKLPAADRLRLLLSRMGIPLTVPASLPDLNALAKKKGWEDGPRALTELRNGIVHPKKRHKVGDAAKETSDAWKLGLWYLELVLLHLFEYRGSYSNRLRARWAGTLEPIPWATS